MIPSSEAFSRVTFTRDEKLQIANIESVIDATLREKFDGAPIRLQFNENITPKIISAIQRKYDAGGWKTAVSLQSTSCTLSLVPVVVPVVAEKSTIPLMTLPPLVLSQVVVTTANRRLLVRMPTRSRPAKALSVLELYRQKAGVPITIEVVLDEDDESMVNAEVLQRLSALGCVITVGKHGSKIAACNGGRVSDWDVLLLASDDMVPVADGYAGRVLKAMEDNFPHLDGAVYFDDGYQGAKCCTLPILGRRFYDQFGYVYCPEYTSLFCDAEQTELFSAMERLVYIDEKIIEHQHPVCTPKVNDALYQKNKTYWKADQAVYFSRKETVRTYSQFVFDSPPLWLSICIATLPSRRAQLDRLLDHLYAQISKRQRQVEILIDNRVEILTDNRIEPTIGAKRQALLERSRGHFVAFIDDDDWVSHDYVDRIVDALQSNPDVDCASLNGVMTTAGQVPERFENSLSNTEWYEKDGVHYRTPNHLSAVRREHALAAGFRSISHAEDYGYAKRLRPLLKKEASIGSAPAYFYWFKPLK